jgi:hypothetical protein
MYSPSNLSVLIGASLVAVLLFGATMFSRVSFTRQFLKGFQSDQNSEKY